MQAEALELEKFLEKSNRVPIIDVRSPIEFKNGHIPCAQNIPLFEDHERESIGKLYKIKGKEEAVMRGIEIVSPKLAGFINSVKQVQNDKEVLIYCFRGGMRSNSFGWLMKTAGLNPYVLRGGYKAYRRGMLAQLEKKFPLVLLGGETGSGKTEILKYLKELGEQVIDLEGLANHKGSAFGFINEKPQPKQQQFENELLKEIKKLDPTKRIWLEDEAFKIGTVALPQKLWLQMKKSTIVKIEVPFEIRVQRLVKDYGMVSKEILERPIRAIGKKLGGQNVKQALMHLNDRELNKVAEIALKYYDNAYRYNHEDKAEENIIKINSETGNAEMNAQKILAYCEKNEICKVK
jgi:tRNA 2-selenouridine synthase